jgi:uncharacterized membrane protein YhaH (DUF805 family)
MGRFFSFNGFTPRSEYWAIIVILLVVGYILGMGAGAMIFIDETFFPGLILLLGLIVVSVWLSLATTARRCRDAGISPYWCLVMLIPYVSFIATIVFGIIPTDNSRIIEEVE